MNCRTFQRRLQSLLDDRLAPEDDSDLIQHTLQCERCHQALSSQQQLWNLLATEPPPAPPADLANRIIAHIDIPLSGLPSARRSMTAWMWLAVAASLLIIIAPIVQQWVVPAKRANPNSFVRQPLPSVNTPLEDPAAATVTIEQPEIDLMLSMLVRFREQQLNESMDELTGPFQPTIRPITASFGVTLDALRRTLPLPSKNGMPEPQADARQAEIFA